MGDIKKLKTFLNFDLQFNRSGRLKLDYSGPPFGAPKRKTRTKTDIFVDDFIDTLMESNCSVTDKIWSIRCLSHQLILSPSQVRKILFAFPNPHVKRSPKLLGTMPSEIAEPIAKAGRKQLWWIIRQVMKKPGLADIAKGKKALQKSTFSMNFDSPRAEVFVCLFNRCVDPPKLCTRACLYDPALFTPDCAKALCQRLGLLRTFDAMGCCTPWRRYSLPTECDDRPGTTLSERPVSQEDSVRPKSQEEQKRQDKSEHREAKAARFKALDLLRKRIASG